MKRTVNFTVIGSIEIDVPEDWDEDEIFEFGFQEVENDWKDAKDLWVDEVWVE